MMAQRLSAPSSFAFLPAASPSAALRSSAALRLLPSPSLCRSFSSYCSLGVRSVPVLCPASSRRPPIGSRRAALVVRAASDPLQLVGAREDIKELLEATSCHPILVRLGLHDAGTYRYWKEWPECGGANGSLRFEIELKHGANAGLVNALKLLQPIKEKFPGISYADLFQLASATAIEAAGGPKIPMKYGRVDISGREQCPVEGSLPDVDRVNSAALLYIAFSTMGFNLKEIIVLSSALAFGPNAFGGQLWTAQPLKFDNSYFKDFKVANKPVFPTDYILRNYPNCKVYIEEYAQDKDGFFKDYASAHAKLSDLGAKFDPPEGISLQI